MEAVLRERLPGLLEVFRGLRVMVVGDLVLDHYLVGDAGRISREYPVVILNHDRDEYRPGGAANTVANLATLGAEVVPAGWIGADGAGAQLVKILNAAGCATDGVLRDPTARTVTKTRIVAGGTQGGGLGQHLLRVDQLGTGAPDEKAENELVKNIEQRANEVDGFVLSDYGHGAVTPRVAGVVRRLSEERYVGLDSRHRVLSYPGVTAATPNLEETAEATGLDLENETEIEEAGALVRAKLDAEALLITGGRAAGGFKSHRVRCHARACSPAPRAQPGGPRPPNVAGRETFLVDEFVGGAWKVEETRKAARLVIEPFGPLSESDRDAHLGEGERLVRSVGNGAGGFEGRFGEGG